MNYEEARDILLKKFDKLCGNYLYQNAEKINYEQALYDGAQALEKQIPKKPLYENTYDDCVVYSCPACKDEKLILSGDNYCATCGQALDWSDTE